MSKTCSTCMNNFLNGTSSCSPTCPRKDGGGAAILYSTTWTHVHSWTWSSRFLFVRLQDPDGIELSFAVCHFHHDATIRAHQWKKLA